MMNFFKQPWYKTNGVENKQKEYKKLKQDIVHNDKELFELVISDTHYSLNEWDKLQYFFARRANVYYALIQFLQRTEQAPGKVNIAGFTSILDNIYINFLAAYDMRLQSRERIVSEGRMIAIKGNVVELNEKYEKKISQELEPLRNIKNFPTHERLKDYIAVFEYKLKNAENVVNLCTEMKAKETIWLDEFKKNKKMRKLIGKKTNELFLFLELERNNLMNLCKEGRLNAIKQFVNRYSECELRETINVLDEKEGVNLLHIACYAGHANIVKYFLCKGADPLVFDKSLRFTALQFAMASGSIAVLELLKNAVIRKTSKFDPHLLDQEPYSIPLLHCGFYAGQIQTIKWLLKNGSKLNVCTHIMNNSILHTLVQRTQIGNKQIELLNIILQKDEINRSMLNIKNNRGFTVLVWAKLLKNEPLIQCFNDNGYMCTKAEREFIKNVEANPDRYNIEPSDEIEFVPQTGEIELESRHINLSMTSV